MTAVALTAAKVATSDMQVENKKRLQNVVGMSDPSAGPSSDTILAAKGGEQHTIV